MLLFFFIVLLMSFCRRYSSLDQNNKGVRGMIGATYNLSHWRLYHPLFPLASTIWLIAESKDWEVYPTMMAMEKLIV